MKPVFFDPLFFHFRPESIRLLARFLDQGQKRLDLLRFFGNRLTSFFSSGFQAVLLRRQPFHFFRKPPDILLDKVFLLVEIRRLHLERGKLGRSRLPLGADGFKSLSGL